MEKEEINEENSSPEVYVRFSLKKLCLMTVVLPMSALVICFLTAIIFQRDDVHETHCRVYNIIPSISAITGISPQRYLWRICVALHIGPRLLVSVIYRDYYRGLLDRRGSGKGHCLLSLCFWLSILEIVTLCGVTYVSNRENYLRMAWFLFIDPKVTESLHFLFFFQLMSSCFLTVHEKIFITFMISSLCYMLMTLKVHNLIHAKKTEKEEHSYKLKKVFFAASIFSTVGLFIFFIKHRFLCHDMAFSWFSTCEYLIAFFNMCFHMTVIVDFPLEEILVGKELKFSQIVGNEKSESNKCKAE